MIILSIMFPVLLCAQLKPLDLAVANVISGMDFINGKGILFTRDSSQFVIKKNDTGEYEINRIDCYEYSGGVYGFCSSPLWLNDSVFIYYRFHSGLMEGFEKGCFYVSDEQGQSNTSLVCASSYAFQIGDQKRRDDNSLYYLMWPSDADGFSYLCAKDVRENVYENDYECFVPLTEPQFIPLAKDLLLVIGKNESSIDSVFYCNLAKDTLWGVACETLPSASCNGLWAGKEGEIILQTEDNQLYQSLDEGATWDLIFETQKTIGAFKAIEAGWFVSAYNSDGTSIYWSSDRGETWSDLYCRLGWKGGFYASEPDYLWFTSSQSPRLEYARLEDLLKVGVEEISNVETRPILISNYPNPFNPMTKIQFSLDQPSIVKIKIYDVLGKSIRILMNDFQTSGIHQLVWNGKDDVGTDVASGVYFCRIEAGQSVRQHKMLLIR